MILATPGCRRSGTTIIESAVVYPVLLFFLIGLIVGGLGVFDYQQVAHAAREAARFASVHAGQYQRDNAAAIAAGTLPDVDAAYLSTLVTNRVVNLDSSKLQVTVTFNTSSGTFGWDDTADNGDRWPYSPRTIGTTTYSETNTVAVTVSYQWIPEVFLIGPFTLTSTSVLPICY